jgi:hypothetical protein
MIDKKNQNSNINITTEKDKHVINLLKETSTTSITKKSSSMVNVLLSYAYTTDYFLYESTPIKLINQNTILLNELIEDLNTTYQINLSHTALSYFDYDLNHYIYCGIYPFVADVTIPFEEDENNIPTIQIKSRQVIKKDNLMRMELTEENPELTDENNQNVFINNKSKRSKERKIGYIIEKVFLWRKLYNGYIDDNGELRKLTLEEAADKVGISKKSLDDYLIQLR